MGMFLNMADILEDRQIGDWKLEKFTLTVITLLQ